MTGLTTSIASLQFKWSSLEVRITMDREEIRGLRIESGSIARDVSPKGFGHMLNHSWSHRMAMSFITLQEVNDEKVVRFRFGRIDSPLVQRQEQKLVPVEKVKDHRCTFPENLYVDIN